MGFGKILRENITYLEYELICISQLQHYVRAIKLGNEIRFFTSEHAHSVCSAQFFWLRMRRKLVVLVALDLDSKCL